MTGSGQWTVRLSASAETDLQEIVAWTETNLGAIQAARYAETLSVTIATLFEGPDVPGVRRRPELGMEIHSLHVAHSGKKGRHLLLFRVSPSAPRVIEVMRILHDAMDLPRHLPPAH